MSAAPALPVLFTGYSAPVNFANKVLEDVEDYMRDGVLEMVKYRVAILEDMLRGGVRRGDSTAIGVASSAMWRFANAYLSATKDNPDARTFVYPDGDESTGWFADELADALRNAAEDSMTSPTSEDDADTIGRALGRIAVDFVEAGYDVEAKHMIEALARAGVSSHQVAASGAINVYTKSTDGLVRAENAAEQHGNGDLATHALAGWAVVTAYQHAHFDLDPPPRFAVDIGDLGPRPPWVPAAALISEADFVSRWHNKLPAGIDAPLACLQWGLEEHARQRNGT